MKNLLTFSLLLLTSAVFAQTNTLNIKKMLTDRSFAFVSSASFADQPTFRDNRQRKFGPAPVSIQRMNVLEQKSLDRGLELIDYANSNSKGVAEKMSQGKNEEVPVVYLQNQNALFHPSIFQPAFDRLVGRNPDSLNNPFALNSYTIQENKNGKLTVNFKVDDDLYNRVITLVVAPDGKAEMTIATAVRRYNNAERTKQYYKGSIQELASL
jgi:hypothetical protein